ncbi:hypothetical protein HBI56_209700 [Parastagonospora nodorum]|uniref:Uncharacterized protein n=2 Tax=Phaeosphaeria nodorum (strain SN15 / ATCC MYA-4574 / FGSC 10173) TaxID=321614 RepID=A0A7U2F9D7_PHANO|nr:hypothetical protein SNOG_15799 [Parastagonospora nodorum SN15]KAH3905283.1 hypothetical protein HBH56_219100 [Parastagonospora nodorum]EAT76894.1 hypothetical protein SNOG_15799 [Parastagonospora nodorum SN15]KAH3922045.1 hypothetical protein HBH54_229220 [Parastagonospora nodorum]KAH3941334.1 hypothetical protein HBH53_203110 [Parastagonospora nodorum]KAH3958654.1 hypothetical protein HBH51_206370 [Parastagonospora nodorum]
MTNKNLDAIRIAPKRIHAFFAFARPTWINEISEKVHDHAEDQFELSGLVLDTTALDIIRVHEVLRVIFIAARLITQEEKLRKFEEQAMLRSVLALHILDHQVDRVSRELAESTIDNAEHQKSLDTIEANSKAELAAHRRADQQVARRAFALRSHQTRGQLKVNRIA